MQERNLRRLALLIRALTALGYVAFGFLLATLWFAYRFGLDVA
jgi:hypothetical protein